MASTSLKRAKSITTGKKITRMRPDKLAKLGIARTFQNIELYTGLSTQDNIMAARHVLMKQNFLTGALYFGPAQKEEIRASPDRRGDYRLSGNRTDPKEESSVFCPTECEKGSSWRGHWPWSRKSFFLTSPWQA